MGHGECLAGTRYPQQDLMPVSFRDAAAERLDGLGLVPSGFEIRGKPEKRQRDAPGGSTPREEPWMDRLHRYDGCGHGV